MKKKITALLACSVLAMALAAGCGANGENSAQNSTIVQKEATPALEEAALPPLKKDLQQLYADAYGIYSDISFGRFAYDTKKTLTRNDMEYYKVIDNRFDDYEAFKTYLSRYFTEGFLQDDILSESNIMFAEGEDGGLYFLGEGRGENPLYAGHTFTLDRETEKEIDFTATAYYVNNSQPHEGEFFYTAPEAPETYTTQDFRYILLQEGGTWKFDAFPLFY